MSETTEMRCLSPRGVHLLPILTLGYLALPCLVFWLSWLWLPFGLVVSTVVVWVAVRQARFVSVRGAGERSRPSRIIAVAAIVVSGIWVALSGAGGIGGRNPDWTKHDAVLSDLISHPWPTTYPQYRLPDGSTPTLTYYIAFYLPEAVVGKVAGWRAAMAAQVLWTWLGAALVLGWYRRLVGRGGILPCLLFPLLGGLNIIGALLCQGGLPQSADAGEFWATRFQYSGDTTLLFFVPQHAIAGWLASALTWQSTREPGLRPFVFLALGLTSLWSPFATAGLLPLAIVATGPRWKSRMAPALLAAALVLGVSALFYASRIEPVGFGWLWDDPSVPSALGTMLLFLVLEVGVFAALAQMAGWAGEDALRRLWMVSLVVLALLPLGKQGIYNDLVMRASIPALFVTWVVVGRALFSPGGSARQIAARVGLVVLVSLGSFSAAKEMADSTAKLRLAVSSAPVVRSVPGGLPLFFARQYLGSTKSVFHRIVARPRPGQP